MTDMPTLNRRASKLAEQMVLMPFRTVSMSVKQGRQGDGHGQGDPEIRCRLPGPCGRSLRVALPHLEAVKHPVTVVDLSVRDTRERTRKQNIQEAYEDRFEGEQANERTS
jgi:hypothetical protein